MLHAINHLLGPLYSALAAVLAFWYGVVPSYGIAIALFTVTVMVVLAPLTIKSTRSMLAMQGLQPEMNKIRAKYKGDRQAMNEELMALYKDAGVSPAGGCLPMFIQLPVFWVLYEVILGLQHTVKVHGIPHPQPRYISTHSLLYQHLIHSFHGTAHMPFWGIDLAKSATSSHASFAAAIPYYVLLAICIGLQYLQMRQLTSRNPQQQTGTAKQMQAMQKFMPLVFGIIYIAIPAGVNIYFLVSSLFRIGQQEVMYRYDPQVKRHLADNKRRQEPAETTERGTKDRSPAPRRAGGEDAPVAGAGAGRPAAAAAPGGFLANLRAARADLRQGGGGAEAGPSWARASSPSAGNGRAARDAGRPAGNGRAARDTGRPARPEPGAGQQRARAGATARAAAAGAGTAGGTWSRPNRAKGANGDRSGANGANGAGSANGAGGPPARRASGAPRASSTAKRNGAPPGDAKGDDGGHRSNGAGDRRGREDTAPALRAPGRGQGSRTSSSAPPAHPGGAATGRPSSRSRAKKARRPR